MNSILRAALAATTSILALGSAFAADDPSAWEKVKAFSHHQKEQAVAEGKKILAATDKQIDELSAQAKKSGAETKAAHQANMKELQAKKKQVQAHVEKLEKSAANTWDATKEGFSNAYKDLHAAYRKAVDSSK